MALTPDDLLNKEFSNAKFRPGFDKDEVDDYIDEVVVEWRRLIQENEDLRAQVASLQEQLDNSPEHVEPDDLKDAGLSGYAGTSAEMTGAIEPIADDTPKPEDLKTEEEKSEPEVEYAPGTAPAQERRPQAEAPVPDEAASAAGVLAMAQKLHDQYVAEGASTRAAFIEEGETTRASYIEEGETTRAASIAEGESKREELIAEGTSQRDQLIAEGTSKREELITEGETTREQQLTDAESRSHEIVTEAETRAENMIEEAELTSARTLNALGRKKSELETRVGELTSFERDYRASLKDYIESQLNELNSKGSIEKEASGS